MNESGKGVETTPERLSWDKLLTQLPGLSSVWSLRLGCGIVTGEISINPITPDDGQSIKNIRQRLTFAHMWAITVAQIPRLQEVVEKGLLMPEEAVAALREYVLC